MGKRICSESLCEGFAHAKGLCSFHYKRAVRAGTIVPKQLRPDSRINVICECGKAFWVEKNRYEYGRGQYCSKPCAYQFRGVTKPIKHHLVGQSFNELIVIAESERSNSGKRRWRCRCSCGTETVVIQDDLLSGHTKSCGHLQPKLNGLSHVERFWSYVDQTAGPDDCWPWLRYRNESGYGRFSVYPNIVLATRWIMGYLAGRELMDGEFVCHHCDNPPCCNPKHLYIGDAKTNGQDLADRKRSAFLKKTHCPQGHPYSEDNTYYKDKIRKTGRTCKICAKAQARKSELKRREGERG